MQHRNKTSLKIKHGMISIIVPIYNVEQYILRCLKSISEQTYRNIEVILVNDGSTDNSGLIAETYARNDKRFIYISKENGGLSSARNEGIKHAKGEYIYFLDSDDWIKKDYLELMIKEFDEEIDIVIGKYTLDDTILGLSYIPFELENINRIFEGEEKEKEIIERHLNAYPQSGYILKDTLMPVWKNLYRHHLIYDNNIFFVSERSVGAEDYVFNFEAYYYAKKIKVSTTAGCVHVIVNASLSRRHYSDFIDKGYNRCEVVKNSIESKIFYNKEAVLYALECEKLRVVLGSIYNIALSTSKNKINIVQQILSDSRAIDIMNNLKRPNIEKKYKLILFLIRFGGIRVTCLILNVVRSNYKLYRKLEHRSRG